MPSFADLCLIQSSELYQKHVCTHCTHRHWQILWPSILFYEQCAVKIFKCLSPPTKQHSNFKPKYRMIFMVIVLLLFSKNRANEKKKTAVKSKLISTPQDWDKIWRIGMSNWRLIMLLYEIFCGYVLNVFVGIFLLFVVVLFCFFIFFDICRRTTHFVNIFIVNFFLSCCSNHRLTFG